jgi:3-hydroxymyristoyl/3-hydroxydecanoyl-(acyl carrier protein) dehydratase
MSFLSNEPKRTLPHRDPFLWVTRLISRNEAGTEGVCELDVRADLDVFKGHFPGNPIFPGVLQVEAAAQACAWIFFGVLPEGTANPGVLFVAIDSYKFKKPVLPPATLVFHLKQNQTRGPLQLWEIQVKVSDSLVGTGRFWVRMV